MFKVDAHSKSSSHTSLASMQTKIFQDVEYEKVTCHWKSNPTAWMNAYLFNECLNDLKQPMKRQKREILIFLDDAPCHLLDVQFYNVKLHFFPQNNTSRVHQIDEDIIQHCKTHHQELLIKQVIARLSIVPNPPILLYKISISP